MPHWLKSIIEFFKRLTDALFPPSPKAGSAGGVQLPPAVKPGEPGAPLPLPPQTPKPVVGEPPRYRKRDSLMTFQKRRFYRTILLRVVDQKYQIFS